jgi:histone deacetylase 1/2
MCYPLTKAYNSNKMQSKSTPCIFLGYSQTKNAYKCLDTHSKKLYMSRNVVFYESQHSLSMPHSSFPHTSLSPPIVQPSLVPASSMLYHAFCPTPNLVDDAHAIVAFPSGNFTSSHHLASLDFADIPSNHTSLLDTSSSLPPSSTPQSKSSSHQFIPPPRLHPMRTQSMN